MTATTTSNPEGEHRPESRHLPDRKHPVHGVLASDSPTIVFLTVCTQDRRPWLAASAVHEALRQVWTEARAWLVGRYVIMPDHVHLFAAPGELTIPFDHWVRYWKSQFTRQHRVREHSWQVDHWDRRLRREDGYDAAWEYVVNNPVRKGLVAHSEEWPYQGTLFELRWD
jgi:putative transposase